jgi:hypothetical protein
LSPSWSQSLGFVKDVLTCFLKHGPDL